MRPHDKSLIHGTIRSLTKICGCMGIINLLSGPHLICISEKSQIGSIRANQVIHKVTKTTITPIARLPIVLTEEEKREEKNYLAILQDLLESFDFYFSYDFDVTHSEQRASDIDLSPERATLPLWQRADHRFFWNSHLQQIFIENEFHPFILPTMDGFIRIINCEINSNEFKYIFISRRSCKRTGARYHMRGADPYGNVANFVETEQIIVFDQVLTSFVQTRGSIPLIWQQKGKGMKPKPMVDFSALTDDAFQSHMGELLLHYGPQVIISLIDQTGGEQAIGNSFETYANFFYNNHRVRYVAFDFHEKCRNNKYENLGELLDKVKPQLDSFGYLFKSTNDHPSLVQSGSFRTNCIDCLDRTNVVQSVLAHHILHSQLTRMGIISAAERIEQHTSFESQFKNVWADNADVMSEQYTGTVALKTDFTRFGKRSVKGTMTDGVNSVRRYINKNFKDDDKQLAIDLLLGKYVVEKWMADSSETEDHVVSVLVDGDATRQIPAFLRIDRDQHCITSSTRISGRKKDYPLATITLLEKSKLHHHQLNIYHMESPSPDSYIFPSSLLREQFLQQLYRLNLPRCFTNPPPLTGAIDESTGLESPRPQRRKLWDMYDTFIGSWNMENITINSTILAEWIPLDKDLYVVAAQRIASDRPSPGFVMNYRQYWFYLIRQYLGPNYTPLAEAGSANSAMIVLIRKTMVNAVNNVSVSSLQKRSPVKKVISPVPTTSSNGYSTSFGSDQAPSAQHPVAIAQQQPTATAPAATSLTSFFFGARKLKDVMASSLSDTSSKSSELWANKYKDVQFGTSITFQLHETSFCFLNYCNNMATGTMDAPLDDGILTIKNRQYIYGSNRYVVWLGDNEPASLPSKLGWTPFINSSGEANHGRGVVYWRSATGADPLSAFDVRDTPAATCLFPPIGCSTSLPVLQPYSWLSTREMPCFIVLKSLVADQFELLTPGTKMEAHLEFNAYHLVCDDNTVRTVSVRSSLPVWSDAIELKSFIDDKSYLVTQYLQVALYSKEMLDHTLIGKGSIPLRDAAGDMPARFKITLALEDEPCATLQGEIQLFSKQEIAKLVQEAALLQTTPPPVPARPHHSHHRAAPSPPLTPSPSSKSPILSFIPSFSPSSKPQPSIPQPGGSSTPSMPQENSERSSPNPLAQSPTTLLLNPQEIGDDQQQQQTPTKSFLGNLTKMVDNIKVSGEYLFKPFSSQGSSNAPSVTSSSDEIAILDTVSTPLPSPSTTPSPSPAL
eukprot:gene7507-8784_t